jgi:hypothetical protein
MTGLQLLKILSFRHLHAMKPRFLVILLLSGLNPHIVIFGMLYIVSYILVYDGVEKLKTNLGVE